MANQQSSSAHTTPAATAVPSLLLVDSAGSQTITLEKLPFTVGRLPDRDLVISDPRVSREHALIVLDEGAYYVVDQGSKHGTFVNGVRVQRHRLERNHRIEFGVREGPYAVFNPEQREASAARQLMTELSGWKETTGASDLEKLNLFLEAARKLNATTVVEDVLFTLLDATLRLTRMQRGYVFLRGADGQMRLAVGRNSKGDTLSEDRTISHSILHEAASSASEFLVSDTAQDPGLAGRNSIMTHELRSIVCIPLRKTRVQRQASAEAQETEVMGVLYLDSRTVGGEMTQVSNDILRAIATEAAALVENAHLVQEQEASRRYQQELAIAASIQQRLMAVNIPEVPFATVRARSIPCREIGGDFYDAVRTKAGLAVVVTDVCGKGVSAALLASILQGIICPLLAAGMELAEIVRTADEFLRQKNLGEQYATLVLALLKPDGELEFVNCGHVPPLLLREGQMFRPAETNLPVGLLPEARFVSARLRLQNGDRFIVVTDGVTEAQDCAADFYGDERLEQVAAAGLDQILQSVRDFCGETPLEDDCTVVELEYRG